MGAVTRVGFLIKQVLNLRTVLVGQQPFQRFGTQSQTFRRLILAQILFTA